MEDWIKEASKIREKDLATCSYNILDFDSKLYDTLNRLGAVIQQIQVQQSGVVREGMALPQINFYELTNEINSRLQDIRQTYGKVSYNCGIPIEIINKIPPMVQIGSIDDLNNLYYLLLDIKETMKKEMYKKARKDRV